jgi:hypothetical protein
MSSGYINYLSRFFPLLLPLLLLNLSAARPMSLSNFLIPFFALLYSNASPKSSIPCTIVPVASLNPPSIASPALINKSFAPLPMSRPALLAPLDKLRPAFFAPLPVLVRTLDLPFFCIFLAPPRLRWTAPLPCFLTSLLSLLPHSPALASRSSISRKHSTSYTLL